MPKKQYRQTDYAKRARKKRKAKILKLSFQLNLSQTEMAKELDLEAHGVTSFHTLAKKLFLEQMEENC